DDLYVADNTVGAEYRRAGSKITAFAQTQLTGGGGWGVAIDNGNGTTNGDVYASNINQGVVNVFAPVHTPGPPAIATNPANAISTTSATLDSQITPQGFDTNYHFEYGPTTAYGTSVPIPDADIGTGFNSQPVSQAITGLQPNTTYHFRVTATNSQGVTTSLDQTLTTAGAPAIDSESSANIARTTVTLQAQVNPAGLPTTYHFEYGTTA